MTLDSSFTTINEKVFTVNTCIFIMFTVERKMLTVNISKYRRLPLTKNELLLITGIYHKLLTVNKLRLTVSVIPLTTTMLTFWELVVPLSCLYDNVSFRRLRYLEW